MQIVVGTTGFRQANPASQIISLTGARCGLRWAACRHKPNMGDNALQLCGGTPSAANGVCALAGPAAGKKYRVQVKNRGRLAGTYRVAGN